MQARPSSLQRIKRFEEQVNEKVVVGVESAAALLGLSKGNVFPLTYIHPSTLTLLNTGDTDAERVSLPTGWTQVVISLDGVSVTSPEQTIIDLLKLNRDPQTIVESMEFYYHTVAGGSWGPLRELAEQNGVVDVSDSFVEDALDQASH